MDIVTAADVGWESVSGHRDGAISFKRLLRGIDGTPNNFELALTRFDDHYRTPRHRHNYDQVRWQLVGDLNYAPGRSLAPGRVGFFPEGVHYGPQDVAGPAVTLALQAGGASGQGFLSYDDLRRGHLELATRGSFTDGIYRGPTLSGALGNMDGYQAIWEHVMQRPMTHAEAPYAEPVIMNPAAFRWRDIPGSDGAAERALGTFTDAQTAVGQLALRPGGRLSLPVDGRTRLLYVLTGTVVVGGHGIGPHTAVHVQDEDAVLAAAGGVAVIACLTLPDLRRPVLRVDAQAAEPTCDTRSLVESS